MTIRGVYNSVQKRRGRLEILVFFISYCVHFLTNIDQIFKKNLLELMMGGGALAHPQYVNTQNLL